MTIAERGELRRREAVPLLNSLHDWLLATRITVANGGFSVIGITLGSRSDRHCAKLLPELLEPRKGVAMAKVSQKAAGRNASCGQFVTRSSSAELKVLRATASAIKKDPERAKRIAQTAGIITSAGNLTRAYGGKR